MKKKGKTSDVVGKRAFGLRSVSGQKNRITAFLVDWLFLWLYLAGVAGWLISTLNLPVNMGICLLMQGIVALLMQLVLMGRGKVRLLKVLLFCILLTIFVIFGWQLWISGIHVLCNHAVDVLGNRYAYLLPAYEVTVAEYMETPALYAGLFWPSALMALPGGYLVGVGNRMLLVIQGICLLLVQMLTGIGPDPVWEIFSMLCLLAVWIRGHGERIAAGRQRLASLQAFLLAAVGTAVLALGVAYLFQKLSVGDAGIFAGWKENLKQMVDVARYDGGSNILPEGQFTGLSSFEPKETPVLEVTMSQPESYYLRGYTGASYTSTGWTEADDALLWESRDLFYWLHQKGFYGQECLGDAAIALDEGVATGEKNTITVRNLSGSSKYCYVPYELQTSSGSALSELLDSQKIGDSGLLAGGFSGSREYTYQALPNQVTKYPAYAAALLDEDSLTEQGKTYQSLEAYYNEFVYSVYLDIPDHLNATLYDLLGAREIDEGEKHADYAKAKQNILYVLTSDYKDTMELKENWDGADFVYDFLSFSKEGYSVHFASAAAMMFRYYGIPARYVEGYLITPQDAESMTAGEPYVLDETHAHAWVEYYQDGVGWLPFETTPSYLNTMEMADDYQDISGSTGGASQEQQEEEQKEEQEETEEQEEEDRIDWMMVLMVGLIVGICLMLLTMLIFFIWVLLQRRKTRKAKRLFESADRRAAVRALYEYTMNVLSVAGLKIRNTSLYHYEKSIDRMFDEETAWEYHEVVKVRQEAVYSDHAITEDQWYEMEQFKDKIWNRIYTGGDLIQKFQLKYIYFL